VEKTFERGALPGKRELRTAIVYEESGEKVNVHQKKVEQRGQRGTMVFLSIQKTSKQR